ncbi:MAG TPA: adenosylcobalamin-dependent ribonucleoside-diphosphate reductase [Candidatus Paceibacterota bacterium]
MTIKKKKILSKANRSLKEKTTIVKNTVSQLDKEVNSSFSENSLKMLQKRYLARRADGTQETPADMMRRVAKAIAVVEKNYGHNEQFIQKTEKQFFEILARHEYTPAGRTMTNAGAGTALIANCIVLPIHDNMESIFETLKDAALLQQAGSGLGFDFSELRPAMTPTKRSNGFSSGPISFLKVYNESFGTIKQQGRHGANMAMMQIDHPDVLDFIRAKEVEGEIRNFNISVKITDEFMKKLTEKPNEQWYCSWRGVKTKPHKVIRARNGAVIGTEEIDITVRELFDEIVDYAWLNGEPGIVFIDEVNRTNPLPGLGNITCSNPCGEQFLHPYDNCNLGSINLAVFVRGGRVDWERLRFVTRTAVRLMDNVIDLFDFPVPQVTELALKNRRIGLGIMGFADMLYELGVAYNSGEGNKIGEKVMGVITNEAHKMSQLLAKEKGAFSNLSQSIFAKKKIKMRNAALTTVAPTGSISMMFDCSSGIEPNFALAYIKQDKDGLQYPYLNRYFNEAVKKYHFSKDRVDMIKSEIVKTGSIHHLGDIPKELRQTFVVAMDISAEDHMRMQAAFQKNVDNSISKTINFPNSATKEEVKDGFILAWKLKCKSATVYRDGSRNVQILNLGTGENIIAPTEISAKGEVRSVSKEEAKAVMQEETPMNLEVDRGKLEPRSRPEVMAGRTYKVKTGYGNLYITINNDEYGAPFEVFATIGKSGGFYQEVSEGICRLASLSLRSGIKVEEIITNLKGIRGPMPVYTNKGPVLSLSDAIGQILEEHAKNKEALLTTGQTTIEDRVGVKVGDEINETPIETNNRAKKKSIADIGSMPGCPDCGSTLQMSEGCISCRSCGFSRCV